MEWTRIFFKKWFLRIILLLIISLIICGVLNTQAYVTTNIFNDIDDLRTNKIVTQYEELIETNNIGLSYKEDLKNRLETYKDYVTEEQQNIFNSIFDKISLCRTRKELISLVQNSENILNTVKETKREEEEALKAVEELAAQEASYNAPDLKTSGVISYGGWRFTWYSSNILYHYRTGEWHTNSQGFWCDDNGYLIAASSTLGQGATVDTPWGTAIIRDSGCAAGVIDMYVCW